MLQPEHRWTFSATVLAYAPEEPGVYAVWKDDEVVYIGHAKRGFGLRQALTEHFEGRIECTRGATHYSWEITLIPEKREQKVLEEYREARGSLPRCNRAAG